jgi:DNA-binding response OmpR family regulator
MHILIIEDKLEIAQLIQLSLAQSREVPRQTAQSRDRNSGGTGIGLTICKTVKLK